MRREEVAITGIGLVTPLGTSAWSTFRALLEGRTTADRLGSVGPGAGVTEVAAATAGIPEARFCSADPSVPLAERAAREALADAARRPGAKQYRNRVRTVVASSKGAITRLAAPGDPRIEERALASHISAGPHGYLCQELAHRLDLGLVTSPVAACATSMYALHEARQAIRHRLADRVLVVGVESALTDLFACSYARLGVLAPTEPIDEHRCLPLDESRAGFTLTECAAAVVLEAVTRDIDPPAVLEATRTATEPHDMVRAPRSLEMLEAVARDLAGGESIAVVQPHATGTPDNDAREVLALERALSPPGGRIPAYASKGALGHPLGASGLVNTVLSCLMARSGRIPPMKWLSRPITSRFALERDGLPAPPGRHLLVSAGFGGHLGGAVLRFRESAAPSP